VKFDAIGPWGTRRRWFWEIEATVMNTFNAKRDVDVERFVSGTDEAPAVDAFNAY